MKGRKFGLRIVRSGRDIILTNGVIEIRLVYHDGGYIQEFFGIDRYNLPHLILSTIHRNLIPLTEHRLAADPMIQSRRRHLFQVNRESLRMVYSEVQVKEDERSLTARLSGRMPDCNINTIITIKDRSKFIKVVVEAELTQSIRPPLIEHLMNAYAFIPDGLLLHQYKKLDYAWAPSLRPADDHIIGEQSFKSPAVVVRRKKLLAALIPDLNSPHPLPVALDLDLKNGLLSAPLLAYGFCKTEPDGYFSYHDASMLLTPECQKIAFTFWVYLDADTKATFGHMPVQEFIWSLASRHFKQPLSGNSVEPLESLPLAYAMKVKGHIRADEIIERALAQQNKAGIIEPPADDVFPGSFDTSICSDLHHWLLAIYRDTESDLRLLAVCKSFGDFLINVQLPSGAIPCWFSSDMIPLPDLKSGAQTAAPGRFLADLYEVTGERRYLEAACEAAKHAAGYAARHRYHDQRMMLSGALEVHDPHTNIPPQGADAARHVADLMIALYRQTGDRQYLQIGLSALIQMCWMQDTWSEQPGRFLAGNALDGDVCDALFGRTLMEYYSITGRTEYIERGLAALCAGLADGSPEAAAIQAWATRLLGSAIVDVRSHSSYPIGQCAIEDFSVKPGKISFNLRNGNTPNGKNCLTIKFKGLRGNSYIITINGEGKRYPKVELESGINVSV